ncbi:hypothetical protein D1B31_18450 [Neobacillus notoginsengisoli]|uniref:Uncharacterized protein n=1 Tax=Neobacillus notoginsengisoli TaxID=1578198 RepID=A0A417YQD4_9BACI|nr:hypothetical protein [Neobacillus notoginsengisoli]RHW36060.1 hypothetical protein D1B31_18450 [Neobacillus notoginsengisoli]
MSKESKRQKITEAIFNRQYQGEVYILTPGRVWKSLVIKHFNKVKRGELSLDELVLLLETKGGVKFAQKHSLVRYPIKECLYFIAKMTKQDIEVN